MLLLSHAHELLASEARELERLRAALEKDTTGLPWTVRSASADERDAIDLALRDGALGQWPSAWAPYAQVVTLSLLPPRPLAGGKRAAEGRGDCLFFRAPDPQPLFSVSVRAGKRPGWAPGRTFTGGDQAGWLLEHAELIRAEARR